MAQQSSQRVSCKAAFQRVLSVRPISGPPPSHLTTTEDSRAQVPHQLPLSWRILHGWYCHTCLFGAECVVSPDLVDIILIVIPLRFQPVIIIRAVWFIHILLMSPSSPPCFQLVSCHLCPFLQSHAAHLAFFPVLLSAGELPSMPVPLILSCSRRLYSRPAFRG